MELIHSLHHPMTRAWLLDGPLSSYVAAFEAVLQRSWYAEATTATYVRALAHFASWMSRCRLTADQIDWALVDQFLPSYLPRCDCHAPALRIQGDL